MQPPNLEDFVYTEEQLDVIKASLDLEALMHTPGWKRLELFMSELVHVAENEALKANTANPVHAIDLLREWQNKHDFLSQIRLHVASLIDQRNQLAPQNKLEELLLQEQLHGRE